MSAVKYGEPRPLTRATVQGKKMTVARKLALMPLASLIGIALLAGILLYQVGSVYDMANYGSANTVPSLALLHKFDANFVGMRLNVWQHVATPDASGMAAAEKQMAGRRQKMEEALKDYQSMLSDEKDKAFYEADRAAVLWYDGLKDKILVLSREGHKAEAIGLLMAAKADLGKAAAGLDEHIEYNMQLAKAASEAAAQTRRNALRIGVLLALTLSAVLGLLGFTLFRQITRQLGGEPADVVRVANAVAQGDFSSRIELRAGDHSSLFATVARMQGDLKVRLEADAARIEAERERARADSLAGVENARIRTALDRVAAAVTLVDSNGTIIYVNDFAVALFRLRAADISQRVPQFHPERLIGSRMADLSAGRNGGVGPDASGGDEEMTFGGATLRLLSTPVTDAAGQRVGTVVQWIDRTDEVAAEREIADTVAKAVDGDLTTRIIATGKQGFFKTLAEGMNALIASVTGVIGGM
jgi:methyl-accepting chemotaxis protein